MFGSAAGFLETRRDVLPGPRPHTAPPHPVVECPAAFGCDAGTGARTERSASSPPTQVPSQPGQVPPTPFPGKRRAAGTYLGPPGPLKGTCSEPRSCLTSSRGHRALPAENGRKMDSRRRPGPAQRPPPPALAPRSASQRALSLFFSRVSLFRGWREWVRGGGSPSGISNCHRPR